MTSIPTVNLSASLKSWRGCTPEKPRGTITQREAAERLGVTFDAIRRVEAGGSFAYPALLMIALQTVPTADHQDKP